MTAVINEAKLTDNLVVNVFRLGAEHRATWMAMMLEEAKKEGIDPESFARAGISRCGIMHGTGYQQNMQDPENVAEFADILFGDLGRGAFEIEVKNKTADRVDVEFGYCPLLKAWQKLGYDDETLAQLCDIAMDGDRGIAKGLGYEISITDTIAKGCPTCKISFYK